MPAQVAPDNQQPGGGHQYLTSLIVDGVYPSALGYSAMTPLASAVIQTAEQATVAKEPGSQQGGRDGRL